MLIEQKILQEATIMYCATVIQNRLKKLEIWFNRFVKFCFLFGGVYNDRVAPSM